MQPFVDSIKDSNYRTYTRTSLRGCSRPRSQTGFVLYDASNLFEHPGFRRNAAVVTKFDLTKWVTNSGTSFTRKVKQIPTCMMPSEAMPSLLFTELFRKKKKKRDARKYWRVLKDMADIFKKNEEHDITAHVLNIFWNDQTKVNEITQRSGTAEDAWIARNSLQWAKFISLKELRIQGSWCWDFEINHMLKLGWWTTSTGYFQKFTGNLKNG